MDYQIIRATPEIGQIEVLYKHEGEPLAVFAIDVPVVDGAFISGEALTEEIQHRAPEWLVTRKQEVATATGFSEISALVQPLAENAPESEAAANAAMWAQVEFEKKLGAALVKFGVLANDPATIGVTNL